MWKSEIDTRIKTLPGILHIPGLARNLIYVSKIVDAGVKTVFKKDRCKMIRGAMVLMRGVQYGTLYKLLGKTVIGDCNSIVVPESSNEENNVPEVSGGEDMLWHQRLGHIGEKGLQSLQGKVWLKVCQNVILISISVSIAYMENRIVLNSLLEVQRQNKFWN